MISVRVCIYIYIYVYICICAYIGLFSGFLAGIVLA